MGAPCTYGPEIISAHKWKAFRMSFKEFSSAQNASSKDSISDKSKAAQATDQPATQPVKKPAEVGPKPKS